jgi:hypothetical protein
LEITIGDGNNQLLAAVIKSGGLKKDNREIPELFIGMGPVQWEWLKLYSFSRNTKRHT